MASNPLILGWAIGATLGVLALLWILRRKDAFIDDVLGADDQRMRRLRAEVMAWRWLHWGNADASWACPCGNANGAGIQRCHDCDQPRPAAGVPTSPFLDPINTGASDAD